MKTHRSDEAPPPLQADVEIDPVPSLDLTGTSLLNVVDIGDSGVSGSDVDLVRYLCPFCSSIFSNLDDIQKHVLSTHSTEINSNVVNMN